ncbi:hypothetical protein ACEUAT_20975 [Aeromonas veronii]|uniref:hypothetical protein n=1 Tax=Aeromonas veronii TaxID=654 RepID=UPI002442951E|nr:hypothetical protein [Aeromonas veronii]HDX8349221.1 hypothetical protein [Aeromonas veronii]
MIEKHKIRILLGNVSPEQLPDIIIDFMIDRYLSIEDEALQYIKVVVSCLDWLITNATTQGLINTSRSEKVGDVSVSMGGGISQVQSWKDLLKHIYKNPNYIDPTLSVLKYLCVIGGTRKDRYREVLNDPNGLGPYLTTTTTQTTAPIDFNY